MVERKMGLREYHCAGTEKGAEVVPRMFSRGRADVGGRKKALAKGRGKQTVGTPERGIGGGRGDANAWKRYIKKEKKSGRGENRGAYDRIENMVIARNQTQGRN